jgi:hypothetical protein
MRRYFCCCGAEIFFDNTRCLRCSREIGFDYKKLKLFSLDDTDEKHLLDACSTDRDEYKFCEHREELGCNWLIPADSLDKQCRSCSLTRVIPVQSIEKNKERWRRLEMRKRRLVYNIFNQGLTFTDRADDPENGLCFDFLEDKRSNPDVADEFVYTGHSNGVITINAAEADPDFRVSVRLSMNEKYRTILGHLRHEIGHYFFERLIRNSHWIPAFYDLFGDFNEDYKQAMDNHYSHGPKHGWQSSFITAYASMHPLEDWAETWQHYLHIKDGLETALSFDMIRLQVDYSNFDDILAKWMEFAVVLNALNRSIGKVDAYPFVINDSVAAKLKMIHNVIKHSSSKNL